MEAKGESYCFLSVCNFQPYIEKQGVSAHSIISEK